MKPAVAARILCVAATLPCTAQTLVRSVSGPTANAQYGQACIRVPDTNADGFDDVLVGAPGFNSQRGAIYCLSGAYLALGTGVQTLWSLAPSVNPGDRFGYAIADIGDRTNDGVRDYMVGQPGYDISGANDVGAVRLVDGALHVATSLTWGPTAGLAVGSAIVQCGDINHDGRKDVAVGAPGPQVLNNTVYFLDGSLLQGNSVITMIDLTTPLNGGSGEEMGTSLASADLDGDGDAEVIIGFPGAGSDTGYIYCVTTAGGFFQYNGTSLGERFGTSVDAAHDYDGDGVIDVVVGAPNYTGGSSAEVGRVVVLSGAKLLAHTPPYEIHEFIGIAGYLSLVVFDSHSGAAVRASGDLNGDGVGDIVVGAPEYATAFGAGTKGYVAIYSGASGAKLTTIFGNTGDHFGDALAGALDDLDGDGFKEFVAAGALSDAGGTDRGVVKCYRLFPLTPAIYCTGKVNSLGCTPSIAFSGTPNANPTAPFLITASNLINQKNGLLFYSYAPTAVSFQGGFKCAANPTVRTPPMNSGGATSGSSCTGTYSFDFNDWIVNGWDFSLGAGAEIYAQYWSRDPQSPSHTSLSNAVSFVINP